MTMKKKPVFRQVVNTLHLWVGVPSALVLVIVCLTGTLYVFQKEIIRWIDSDQYRVNITGTVSKILYFISCL
ncbi:MAG: PepSY domain-containing protein [Chitinophagaceae bacterium]|nr:PepSY domain-containing protein [Chitinophagaceae bacterium]